MDGESGTSRSRNISVSIRIRPVVELERLRGESGSSIWATDKSDSSKVVDRRTGEVWNFDHVFGPLAGTSELYECAVRDVVGSFCEGVNGTIFAYGQTASGKTYTMQGDGHCDGIIQLAVRDIFRHISQHLDHEYRMQTAYLEIYNEQVFDLLSDDDSEVRVLNDQQGQTELRNLTWHRVTTGMQEILERISEGDQRRHKGETKMNEHSSRSHAIHLIELHSRSPPNSDGQKLVRRSTLSLVDLAGSEGLRHTEATGERLREGKNINRSLFALSQVISSLAEQTRASRTSHVGFRDSKLTRILQKSIGGNAQTAIVCNVSPTVSNYVETKSTLDFASRAKCVKNKVTANIYQDNQSYIRQLQDEIAELQADLEANQEDSSAQILRGMKAENSKLQRENQATQHKIEAMESAVLGLKKSQGQSRGQASTQCAGAQDLEDEVKRLNDAVAKAEAEAAAAEAELQARRQDLAQRKRGAPAKGSSSRDGLLEGAMAQMPTPQKRARDAQYPHQNFKQWQKAFTAAESDEADTPPPKRGSRRSPGHERQVVRIQQLQHSGGGKSVHGSAPSCRADSSTSTMELASELLKRLTGEDGLQDSNMSEERLEAVLNQVKKLVVGSAASHENRASHESRSDKTVSSTAIVSHTPSGLAEALAPSLNSSDAAASSSSHGVKHKVLKQQQLQEPEQFLLALPAPPGDSPTPQPVSPPARRVRRRRNEETVALAEVAGSLEDELKQKLRDLETAKAHYQSVSHKGRHPGRKGQSLGAALADSEEEVDGEDKDGQDYDDEDFRSELLQEAGRDRIAVKKDQLQALLLEKQALQARLSGLQSSGKRSLGACGQRLQDAVADQRLKRTERGLQISPRRLSSHRNSHSSEGEAALAELRETLRRRKVELARVQLQQQSAKVAREADEYSDDDDGLPEARKEDAEDDMDEDGEDIESSESPAATARRLFFAEKEAGEVLARNPQSKTVGYPLQASADVDASMSAVASGSSSRRITRSPPCLPSAGRLSSAGRSRVFGEEEEDVGMSAAEFRALADCVSRREEKLRTTRTRRKEAEMTRDAAAAEAAEEKERLREAERAMQHAQMKATAGVTAQRQTAKARADSQAEAEASEMSILQAALAEKAAELSRAKAELADADEALARTKPELQAALQVDKQRRQEASSASTTGKDDVQFWKANAEALQRQLAQKTTGSRPSAAPMSHRPLAAAKKPVPTLGSSISQTKRSGAYGNGVSASARLSQRSSLHGGRLGGRPAGSRDGEGCQQM
eukprot:TRINITY_DN7853_c2_g3_i1.p1 TRINITY_DN7853_c2_g3~~TRINITY_DN7853_c2_g3_i1.p1  ORF type:complete len:1267 (-),score=340.43 TRINITY_DN7853_c2_g3_i1:264-4064(-)